MRYIEACQNGEWHLELSDPSAPEKPPFRVPFRCRSWRHKGKCSWWKGSQDFARSRELIEAESQWTYIVLTLDPKEFVSQWQAYRKIVFLWSKLRKRMVRQFGRMKYLQTLEAHRSGWPHLNVIIYNSRLFALAKTSWRVFRRGWLEKHAVDCGFGCRTWIEPVWGKSGEIAGYLTKLSRELTGTNVKDQTPYNAPRNFRRLRASAHCLPPVYKTGLTGRLLQCPIEDFVSPFRAFSGSDVNAWSFVGKSGLTSKEVLDRKELVGV